MLKAFPMNMSIIVLALAVTTQAAPIKSISVDTVVQTTVGSRYLVGGMRGIGSITIEPTPIEAYNATIAPPIIRLVRKSDTAYFASSTSLSDKLFNAMDTMPYCCMRDRAKTPYRFLFGKDSVSLEYDFDDAGCPYRELDGFSGLVCALSPGKYRRTMSWEGGDGIVYSDGPQTVAILNTGSSSLALPRSHLESPIMRITGTRIQRACEGASPMVVSIRDVRGAVVRTIDLSGRESASIADLDAGLYVFDARTGDGRREVAVFAKAK